MTEQKDWNVIFLVDNNPPSQVMLLKRGLYRQFAPGYYTGTGGKVEPTDKSILTSAIRELREETGLEKIPLNEFARVIVDNDLTLYYFWGVYSGNAPASNEGTLEWTPTDQILKRKVIPTTLAMCREWHKREFSLDPFTIYVRKVGEDGTVRLIEVEEVLAGLQTIRL